MNKLDMEFYLKIHMYHEANRTSTNDRNEFWRLQARWGFAQGLTQLKPRTETSFKMNKFS